MTIDHVAVAAGWRRHLHRHPELGFEERETGEFVAATLAGACPPLLGSEDFGLLAEAAPGCFTLIGNGTEPGAGGTPLHSSGHDFNDDIIATGVAHVNLVRSLLPGPA